MANPEWTDPEDFEDPEPDRVPVYQWLDGNVVIGRGTKLELEHGRNEGTLGDNTRLGYVLWMEASCMAERRLKASVLTQPN